MFVLGWLAGTVRAALPQPELIARIHFAGAQKLSAGTNASAFTNEFCSAEALALRQQTADKLSAWLAIWLPQQTGAAAPGGAASLRPLLDDLQQAEWFFGADAASGGKPAVALCVKLEPQRAELWKAGLRPFFPSAIFTHSKGWLIFQSSPEAIPLGRSLLLKTAGADTAWLAFDINWSHLAQWCPPLQALSLPETQCQITAPDNQFRIQAKLLFPETLSLNLEPWQLPTNTLHQPFVSFTAARGFGAWLKSQPWMQPYELTPAPNQLISWALPQVPYQTFAAIPFADAAGALAQAYDRLKPAVAAINAQNTVLMPMSVEATNREVSLRGIPFVAPYLRTVQEPSGQFLLAGAFPNTPRSKPLPPELFQRLAAKDLAFYHWEITAERMPQLLHLNQLALMLTAHRQLGSETPSMKWIQKITPQLGNCVTEVTQTGPAELTLTRKAPGGLTAMEFFALGCWLEAPNFPGCDLKQPPHPKALNRPHAPPPAMAPPMMPAP